MSPSMRQSIEILLLPVMDLNTSIEQELQSNPLLEIIEENQKQDSRELDEALSRKLDLLSPAPEYASPWSYGDDDIVEPRPVQSEESLEDDLLHQLRIECSDPLELKIGEFIIGNIDEDGYLAVTCEEIAQALSIPGIEIIERVLNLVRKLDPPGIGSRDLKECLLTQFEEMANVSGNGEIVSRVICNFLKELGQRHYERIAKKLKVSIEDVHEAARIIAALEPNPARNHRPVNANIYIKPDVVVTKTDEGYQMHLNEKDIPALRINLFYKKMLKQDNLNPEEMAFIREKLQNALLYIKSIRQRGTTLKGIAQYILDKQKGFFDHGHMALVPMALKDVAQVLDRNESTISRAVSNKYIDTPRGVYPMKFFFSQAVRCIAGGGGNPTVGGTGGGADSGVNDIIRQGDNNEAANVYVSNRSIKEEMKELIAVEDKSDPLSDSDIQKYFEHKKMKIARRTINKYRKIMKILPSYLRKETGFSVRNHPAAG